MLGSRAKAEENGLNGEEISPPHLTLGPGERRELSQRGPAENGFIVI